MLTIFKIIIMVVCGRRWPCFILMVELSLSIILIIKNIKYIYILFFNYTIFILHH